MLGKGMEGKKENGEENVRPTTRPSKLRTDLGNDITIEPTQKEGGERGRTGSSRNESSENGFRRTGMNVFLTAGRKQEWRKGEWGSSRRPGKRTSPESGGYPGGDGSGLHYESVIAMRKGGRGF